MIDASGLRVTEEGGKKRTLHDLTLKQIKSWGPAPKKKSVAQITTTEGEVVLLSAKGRGAADIVGAVQGAKMAVMAWEALSPTAWDGGRQSK